jgi:hypothetical protein
MCQDVRGDVAIKTTTMLALAALNIFAGFFMSATKNAPLFCAIAPAILT